MNNDNNMFHYSDFYVAIILNIWFYLAGLFWMLNIKYTWSYIILGLLIAIPQILIFISTIQEFFIGSD